MYIVDEKVLQAYSAESREIYIRATFNNETVVTGEHIKSFTVTDSVGNADSLSLGNACSKKLELDMFVPDDLKGIAKAKIKVEIGIDVDGNAEYTPLGIFYVDDYKTSNDYKSVQITAFDSMLKINETLGDTYTCGLSSTDVTPLAVIRDICSQAGVSVSIGASSEDKSSSFNRTPEGISYDTEGVKLNSNSAIGTANLIAVPNDFQSINIKLLGLDEADLTCSTFRAVYFKDAEGKSFYSYKDYDDATFGDILDTDADGNLVQYVEGTIKPPSYNGTLYLGFCFNTSDFESVPDTLRFQITTQVHRTNYVNSTATIPNPQKVDISARDMLGYMAGILGCNAVIDRAGNFTIRKLEVTSNNVPYKLQFLDGLEKTNENLLTPEYITTGSSSDENGNGGVITVGNGYYGFNFENPYITSETVARNILNFYKDLVLMPCNVHYRGNPSVDCGDIISVQDKNLNYYPVLVINNTVSVTGGMSAKIDGGLKTDVKKDFISVPNSKKLEYKVDSFIAAYQDIVKKLVGVNGGYVQQVKDDNDVVRALAITQSNIEVKWDETNGKVVAANSSDKGTAMWVWSYGGLSFSPNGGITYNVAINMAGEIYANRLLAATGTIGGWTADSSKFYSKNGNYYTTLKSNGDVALAFGSPSPSSTSGANIQIWHNGRTRIGYDAANTRYIFDYNPDYLHKGNAALKIHDLIFEKDGIFANSYTAFNVFNQKGYSVIALDTDGIPLFFQGARFKDTVEMKDAEISGAKISGLCLTDFVGSSQEWMYLGVNSSGNLVGVSSSKRYKENITEVKEELDPKKLYDLPIVQYNYKEEYKDIQLMPGTQIGFLADDVDKYYPNACIHNKDGQAESWQDRIMIPAMLKLIQEQHAELEEYKSKLDEVEIKLNKVLERIGGC